MGNDEEALLVLGLTGKAGSGFDTDIAAVLEADLGFHHLRIDDAIDRAWEDRDARVSIGELFGKTVVFDNSDERDPSKWTRRRGVLGKIVSEAPDLQERLNRILLPCAVVSLCQEIRRVSKAGKRRITVTATRLVNAELRLFCHFLWYVERDDLARKTALLKSYIARGFDKDYVTSKVDHVMQMQSDVIGPDEFAYDLVMEHPEDFVALRDQVLKAADQLLDRYSSTRPEGARYFRFGTRHGQFFRSILSLSQILHWNVRLEGGRLFEIGGSLRGAVRACVEAIAKFGGGRFRFDADRETLEYWPGAELSQGTTSISLSNRQSISILVITLLPICLKDSTPRKFVLRGATELNFSSPTDYYRRVFFPLLERLGMKITFNVDARGFLNGPLGSVRITVRGTDNPSPAEFIEKGEPTAVHFSLSSVGLSTGLGKRFGARMREFCKSLGFQGRFDSTYDERVGRMTKALAMSVAVETDHTILGADVVVDTISTDQEAVDAMVRLEKEVEVLFSSPAALDPYTSDKMLLYLALVGGAIRIPVRSDMEHVYTQMSLISSIHPGKMDVSYSHGTLLIEMEPLDGSR